MTWTIHIAKRAERQLARSPAKSRRLLLAALVEMQQNPFSGDIGPPDIRAVRLAPKMWGLSDLLRCLSNQTGIMLMCSTLPAEHQLPIPRGAAFVAEANASDTMVVVPVFHE